MPDARLGKEVIASPLAIQGLTVSYDHRPVVHSVDKPVREAAELVASRRQAITGAGQRQSQEAAA